MNRYGQYGRWTFAEFTAVFEVEAAFNRLVEGLQTWAEIEDRVEERQHADGLTGRK